jgi:hypothetical protein
MTFSNGKRFISYPQEHAVNAFLLCPLCNGSIFVGVTMLDGNATTPSSSATLATSNNDTSSPKRCKLDKGSEVDDSGADVSDSDATREESDLLLPVIPRVSLLSPPMTNQEDGKEESVGKQDNK